MDRFFITVICLAGVYFVGICSAEVGGAKWKAKRQWVDQIVFSFVFNYFFLWFLTHYLFRCPVSWWFAIPISILSVLITLYGFHLGIRTGRGL